jgi:hypothetical protein
VIAIVAMPGEAHVATLFQAMHIAMAIVPAARFLGEVAADGAEIANLPRANVSSSLLNAGENLFEFGVIFKFRNRDIRADGPHLAAALDFVQRQRFDVHEDFWLGDVLLHFAEKVHAAGQITAISADKLASARGRGCRDVLEGIHTYR